VKLEFREFRTIKNGADKLGDLYFDDEENLKKFLEKGTGRVGP